MNIGRVWKICVKPNQSGTSLSQIVTSNAHVVQNASKDAIKLHFAITTRQATKGDERYNFSFIVNVNKNLGQIQVDIISTSKPAILVLFLNL